MLICATAKLFVINSLLVRNARFLIWLPFLQSICKLLLITFKHRAFHICAMVDFVVKFPSKITFCPIIHHQEEVISITQRSHEVFRPFDNSLTQALFAVAANLRLILYRQFLQVRYRISLNLFKGFTGGDFVHLRILLCNSTNVFQCVDNVHIVRKAKLRRIGQIIIRVQNKLRHRNNFVTVLCLHLCNVIAKRLHFSAVGVKVLAVIAHTLQQCAHLEEVLLCSPYFFLTVHLLSDVLSCAFNLMFGLDCFTIQSVINHLLLLIHSCFFQKTSFRSLVCISRRSAFCHSKSSRLHNFACWQSLNIAFSKIVCVLLPHFSNILTLFLLNILVAYFVECLINKLLFKCNHFAAFVIVECFPCRFSCLLTLLHEVGESAVHGLVNLLTYHSSFAR